MPGPDSPIPRDSYLRSVAPLVGVLAILAAIAAAPWVSKKKAAPLPLPPPVVADEPEPPPPAPAVVPKRPTLDREAVARAEEGLAAARRDRSRAADRVADASAQLRDATARAATARRAANALLAHVRDPRTRLEQARARGEVLRAERDQAGGELASWERAPRPRRKALIDKSPVARPTDGSEYHFEVLHDRVAFIDLDRLLDRVKDDVRIQVRLSQGGRSFTGQVGPVGGFSIRYTMSPDPLDIVGSLLGEGRGVNFTLSSWEILPERGLRGETLAEAFQPASDFIRAIRRLNPGRDMVTFWVYPDGFPLYRQLRDQLHDRGLTIAARPLPAGMPIRGSNRGSVSAGQ